MKIAVVGTGYVGLVTGTCFAETGNDVICVDIDASTKVEKMRNGEVPIYEPHLDVLVREKHRKRAGCTSPLIWPRLSRRLKSSFWHCPPPQVRTAVLT